MKRIDVGLGARAYPVYVGPGALRDSPAWTEHLAPGAVLVVSDERVAPLYLDTVCDAIGREVDTLELPEGEHHKTMTSWQVVLDHLAEGGARRDATVVALGGGVIGDLAGFAAACWMRGVRVIQAPTTLLAQVDASVGGKTGFNHPRGKNLVGAFHQPAAVIADTATLATLDAREFRAGLAEVAKYGAIRDAAFLEWLGEHATELDPSSPLLEDVVARSVRHKAEVVAADEFEAGPRMLLNFGHTFGHALETVTAYQRYLHGEAVAIGMAIAARLSVDQLGCPAEDADALVALLQTLGLPVTLPRAVSTGELLEAMQMDKKGAASGLRLVLLARAGEARVVEDVPGDRLRDALDGARE